MDLMYNQDENFEEFLANNRSKFETELLNEAVNVKDKIKEIHLIGNINLLDNAYKLILFVVNEQEQEVSEFAQQEGIVWAKYKLTLAFKLEWVQAIRRTLWIFMAEYDKLSNKVKIGDDFYEMERKVNDLIDQFLNCFFISYSNYKDDLLDTQRKLVNNLSVPIIPISSVVSILPLIGKIDTYRINIIIEKVLFEINRLRVQTLIMDLSGIMEMEEEAIQHFLKLLDGIAMMGCRAVITGLRPEIAQNMIDLNVEFGSRAVMKGSLQQVIKRYLTTEK